MYNGTCIGAKITITDFTTVDGDALNIKGVPVNYDALTNGNLIVS